MEIIYKPVDVYHYSSKEEFKEFISNNRQPLLIKGLNIGECKTKWTVSYLAETIKNLTVTVHVSPGHKMSFLKKNFTYVKMPFNEFLYRASDEYKISEGRKYKPILCENEVLYFRSVSFDRRGREIADINKHFPQIAADFISPDLFNQEDFFSSVFRIASPKVQVWTHYDIMDNVLVQISGTKRVVLFSPKDAEYMYMNGDKSEVLDIDNPDVTKYPLFLNALQHECILEPGDALYIPALWFHNVMSNNFSISINVFWKHLPHEYYDKTDVYGNKDLIPATKAFAHIKKASELLNTLPKDYKDFYITRCITDLKKSLEEASKPPDSKIGDKKIVIESESSSLIEGMNSYQIGSDTSGSSGLENDNPGASEQPLGSS